MFNNNKQNRNKDVQWKLSHWADQNRIQEISWKMLPSKHDMSQMDQSGKGAVYHHRQIQQWGWKYQKDADHCFGYNAETNIYIQSKLDKMIVSREKTAKNIKKKNKLEPTEKKNRQRKKTSFPHRESNPGHGGESAGS